MIHSAKTRVFKIVDLIPNEISVADSTVITGFWRSGTTWLQLAISDAVKGRSVFEPFHREVEKYCDLIDTHLRPPVVHQSFIKAYMPYCADFEDRPALWDFLKDVMKGRIRETWLNRGRNIQHITSDRVVVKFVRGQLMQPAFSGNEHPALIHVQRDPRAVLASLLRKDWCWWMRSLSLKDQLLSPDDGRAKYFSQWTEDVERADRETFPARFATYWALTERFVMDRGLPESGGTLIRYENVCLERAEYLNQVLSTVLPVDCPIEQRHLRGESPTTQGGRSGIIEERIHGWKDELTTGQVKDVERVVQRFELDHALIG